MRNGNGELFPRTSFPNSTTADVNILRHMLSISGGIVDFGEKSEDRTITKKKKIRHFSSMASSSSQRQKKRSIADGLGAMALGSVLTTGGVAAGVTVAASVASQVKHVQQASGDQELLVSIDKHKIDG